jgi:hypothetical protein
VRIGEDWQVIVSPRDVMWTNSGRGKTARLEVSAGSQPVEKEIVLTTTAYEHAVKSGEPLTVATFPLSANGQVTVRDRSSGRMGRVTIGAAQ